MNGRSWYKNDAIAKSIWWDDKDNDWMLGSTTRKGSSKGFAYLDNNERCLPKIPNQKWKLYDSNWNDAENKVKVRCGYKPKGKWELSKVINVMLDNNLYILLACK